MYFSFALMQKKKYICIYVIHTYSGVQYHLRFISKETA